jgi:hypothetical protein
MKRLLLFIFLFALFGTNCFSQEGEHLDIGSWKVDFEKDREFTVNIIIPSKSEEVNSMIEYNWDDVLFFRSKNAHRNSFISIESTSGKEFKRFFAIRKRKLVTIRVDFDSLKNLLDSETLYRIVIHNQNQELPLMVNFTLSKKLNN